MASQSYQLVVRSGPNVGKVIDLEKDELTIGRDITNDIVMNDAEVSRHHARLTKQGGSYVLEDTGSTNGTFVDGQRLMGPHVLQSGEVVLLGENVSLVYEASAYDPNATMVSGAGIPEPVSIPSAQSTYVPEVEPEPYQEPVYSGQVPPGPVESYPAAPAQKKNNTRTWVLAGCGCLALVCLCLVAGAFIFDAMDLYCTAPFDVLLCP